MNPTPAGMPEAAPRRALCVALHDVAPATWPACQRLLEAVNAAAPIPLTFLVVPRFHGDGACDPAFDAAMATLLAQQHELALHGWTHLDQGPPPATLGTRLLRSGYTTGEGEFAAVQADEARRRIELGLGWFYQRGWQPAGFVAPAWLLSGGAWEALREYRFAYTTTYGRFHLLPGRRALCSPALVYAARNRAGRLLSPPAASALALALRRAPLVRVALHPRDAEHPALLRHATELIARLLDGRTALTKAAVAARWGARWAAGGATGSDASGIAGTGTLTSTGPSVRPSPSDAVRSRRCTPGHSAAHRPWR